MKRIMLMLSLILAIALCTCAVAVAEQDFTFSEHQFTIFEGETLSIPLLRQGEAVKGDVSWTSSNQRIASVDADGMITALKKGTTTVSAQIRVSWNIRAVFTSI